MLITILKNPVYLLNFPKEYLPDAMHAIVKIILHPNSETLPFFNYSESTTQVSIVTESPTDFKHVPFVQITETPFRTLSIHAEDDSFSGKRIVDLSWPLAQNAISIFYLSTYQSDFIFVRERRLKKVVSILEKRGYLFDGLEILDLICASPLDDMICASPDIPILSDIPVKLLLNIENEPETNLRLAGVNRESIENFPVSLISLLFYSDSNHELFSFTFTHDGISILATLATLSSLKLGGCLHLDPERLCCVQSDLSNFSTDKYGIVWRLSEILAAKEIGLMYLSTLTSANVLCLAKDLESVREILLK